MIPEFLIVYEIYGRLPPRSCRLPFPKEMSAPEISLWLAEFQSVSEESRSELEKIFRENGIRMLTSDVARDEYGIIFDPLADGGCKICAQNMPRPESLMPKLPSGVRIVRHHIDLIFRVTTLQDKIDLLKTLEENGVKILQEKIIDSSGEAIVVEMPRYLN